MLFGHICRNELNSAKYHFSKTPVSCLTFSNLESFLDLSADDFYSFTDQQLLEKSENLEIELIVMDFQLKPGTQSQFTSQTGV